MVKRSKTANIQLKVRMKESLREHLARAAKTRGVSLNNEVVDRLQHSRERVSLLEEVLKLAFSPQWAAFLAEADRHGILLLRSQDKETLRTRINRFIDQLPEKTEKKS